MYIQHTHPADVTPEEQAEALSALYHVCIRKLYGSQPPWGPPQRSSPAPHAQ